MTLLVLTVKTKVRGILKKFLLLTEASFLGLLVSFISLFVGEELLFKTKKAPPFIEGAAAECINLENKVVLSIAIRLTAEAEMIRRINDSTKTDKLKDNQTVELFKVYKGLFNSNISEIELLDQVVMMTPEPIHLNSFMYEPLIDLSDHHLKELYRKVKAFNTTRLP